MFISLPIGVAIIIYFLLITTDKTPQIISYQDEWCLYSLDGGRTVKAVIITEYDIKISGSVMDALKKKL